MYQGHLNVKDELTETIRALLEPRERYTVNEVKDKIGKLKFRKDLINSIVRNLNGDLDYKHLTDFQLASLLKTLSSSGLTVIRHQVNKLNINQTCYSTY